MQETSELYKSLLARGARKEVRVDVAGEIYGEDRIVSLHTGGGLFKESTLCVGSAVAKQIDLVLWNYGDIPKRAKLIPSYRLVDGDEVSEWIQKGVFYIDTREPNDEENTLTIHGFDDMLKGERIWEPAQDLEFPMSYRAAALEMARLMGVELENPEDIEDTEAVVDYPTDDYTQRQVLGFIAGAHMGNFVMTDLGKLRLVKLGDIPEETSLLVDETGAAISIGGVCILV